MKCRETVRGGILRSSQILETELAILRQVASIACKGGLPEHDLEFAQAAPQVDAAEKHLIAGEAHILSDIEMTARPVFEGDHSISLRTESLDRQA